MKIHVNRAGETFDGLAPGEYELVSRHFYRLTISEVEESWFVRKAADGTVHLDEAATGMRRVEGVLADIPISLPLDAAHMASLASAITALLPTVRGKSLPESADAE
jgi:hypothetical protein